MKRFLGIVGALAFVGAAHAADLPVKAPTINYAYPTTKCGLYYGVNTTGATSAVENAAIGTQVVQAGVGLTLGYTCPVGGGYWFVDADFDFANLNGSANGFNASGPAMFSQRFGFGAPIPLILSLIPGLASLQNAVPSLIPLPSGTTVVTTSPYLAVAVHEDDTGVSNGFAANKAYLISAGFQLGTKTRLSNGVVFDPYAEYVLPSTELCIGIAGGCFKRGSGVRVGAKLEF